MDQQSLTIILTQVLGSDEKWCGEVERNSLLQEMIDQLFQDEIFQILLENQLFPKFQDTNLPHFRAIELICTFREIARQFKEEGQGSTSYERELEDLMFKISDKWNTADSFDVNLSLESGIVEANRIVQIGKMDRQFPARIERFRLLVVPLCLEGEGADGSSLHQIMILENVRAPRGSWKNQK